MAVRKDRASPWVNGPKTPPSPAGARQALLCPRRAQRLPICLAPLGLWLFLRGVLPRATPLADSGLALALVGAEGPARWLCDSALAAAWSVPLLLLLSLGGPILSVIATVILQLDSRLSHKGWEVWGMIAWIVLLLSMCTIVPFPLLFMVGAD